MRDDLEKFEHLWAGVDNAWVLVRREDDPGRYLIFNTRTQAALILEDDGLHQAICRRMLDAGVTVLEKISPGDWRPPGAGGFD